MHWKTKAQQKTIYNSMKYFSST